MTSNPINEYGGRGGRCLRGFSNHQTVVEVEGGLLWLTQGMHMVFALNDCLLSEHTEYSVSSAHYKAQALYIYSRIYMRNFYGGAYLNRYQVRFPPL